MLSLRVGLVVAATCLAVPALAQARRHHPRLRSRMPGRRHPGRLARRPQDQDRLGGGAGNDVLSAGPGAGRTSGGPGNDVINVVNGRRDRVDCGSGRRDRVKADRKDRVKRCERVKRVGRKR